MKQVISATLVIVIAATLGAGMVDNALNSIEARDKAVKAVYVDAGIQWAQENKQ